MARVRGDWFSIIATFPEAQSVAELDQKLKLLVEDWGFDRWTALPIAGPTRAPVEPFDAFLGRPNSLWRERYREARHFEHDEMIQALKRTDTPLWWTEFERTTRVSKEQRTIFAEARACGVGNGLSIPVATMDGSIWACALTGPNPTPHREISAAAQLLAHQYVVHGRRVRRFNLPVGRKSGLTPGQARIVALLADGLRPKDVAHRLNIHVKTVYHQVQFAKQRVGAKTTA